MEDDEDITLSLRTVLEMMSYEVRAAKNGAEALAELRNGMPLPSLILLDLMMPLMDGTRFREEQLRDPLLAKVPVVVVSAVANAKEDAKKLGARAVIEKPIDMDDFLRLVESFFAA